MTKLHDLAQQGQSVWLDYIQRSFIDTGELQNLLDQGVRGVTSNPAIFEKAIAGSADYDSALQELVAQGQSVGKIYEALVIDDIRRAADLFRPVYDAGNKADGYVSLEVSPTLADDTAGTIAEARRLFATLDRPNVMIKIPATPAGLPAIEAAIAEGINVNVTLIFSLAQYQGVVEAYLSGLEKRLAAGGDLSGIASVASFFVSRVDTAVDKALEAIGNTELQGKIAVDNGKVAYAYFTESFSGPRWEKLAAHGAQVQRPLWASTGVKNPAYSDTLYVDTLIGPHTVNTLPPATLEAYIDHGTVAHTIETAVAESQARLTQLAELGIDLAEITQTLQVDGVQAFADAFEALLGSIAQKRADLQGEWVSMATCIDEAMTLQVDEVLTQFKQEQTLQRIWAHDHTVWKSEPTEITNRLGWLNIAEDMLDNLGRIASLVRGVQADGYTHALLLGMGGSSLGPEVFREVFGVAEGYLDLAVLDSTDPGAVLAYAETLDPAKTLFIVSTKSGGTVETLSFFKYFYNRTAEAVGSEGAGAHFIAITDPGSKLADLATQYNFRATFINDPNIGGRYSVLSYFGLVPAALVGVDVTTLLDRALTAMCDAGGAHCGVKGDNDAARLGVIMGECAKQGRDKVTLIMSPAIESFGDWVEQLIAESTGKEGRGILPVVGESLGAPAVYGQDRLFVYLRLAEDDTHDEAVGALLGAGLPMVTFALRDVYDLGYHYFIWEMATAIAGVCLNINPFDQPNVESAKVLARQMVAAYETEGHLPELTPTLQSNGLAVYGSDNGATTPAEALRGFLAQAGDGAYLALHAYLTPNAETTAALQALRSHLRDSTKLATTLGYGPRFLHSTGQLHKGDAGHGLFIQFTADDPREADIPDEAGRGESAMTFGVLKSAQALGDRQALLDGGRGVIRFHLGADVVGQLKKLTADAA